MVVEHVRMDLTHGYLQVYVLEPLLFLLFLSFDQELDPLGAQKMDVLAYEVQDLQDLEGLLKLSPFFLQLSVLVLAKDREFLVQDLLDNEVN